jgi:uncharacterized protein (TIGR03086 family)
MEHVGERYAAALDEIDRHMHAIREDQWAGSTPCSEWNVRDLVDHIVYETLWVPDLLDGKTLAEVGDRYEGDRLGTEPVAAWARAYDAARAAAIRDGALTGTVHTSGGETTAQDYMSEMLADAVIHGWDLAEGIDATCAIDPATAEDLLGWYEPFAERMRAYGAMADPVEVGPDADAATRLIAMSGRTP